MDTRDGRIYPEPDAAEFLRRSIEAGEAELKARQYLLRMRVQPTDIQMGRRPPCVGRNEPCPCGSGKRFKRCCLGRPVEPPRPRKTIGETK